VFVPIVGSDTRPYEVRWNSVEYLRSVEGLEENELWIGEIAEGLRRLRDIADRAETPDELKGYNAGIASLKRLLTLPERAKRQRGQIESMKEQKKTGYEFG